MSHFPLSLIIVIKINCLIFTNCVNNNFNNIVINRNAPTIKFNHFWKSTGFCPLDKIQNTILSEDEKFNLALIGSLPINGIKYVRIHWLINLITINNNNYNFDKLDELIKHLDDFNLLPGFELMGVPSGMNLNDPILKSEFFWADLVEKIATRYIEKYGINKVSKWRFESWNEPDLKVYNILHFSNNEYTQYISGCAKGLKSAFNRNKNKLSAKLGGPAGLFRSKSHPFCWGLLETCNSLGKSQCPIQYISFHRKGNATVEGVLNGTVELLDLIRKKFPKLRRLPIANDESDLIVNWSKSYEWRGDVRYAAMISKVISDYFQLIHVKRKLKIEVLSNDNAFLNYHPFYFTQRTLLARFQINNTNPPHSQFIKKPVYSLMALLSFLGDEYLQSSFSDPLLTVIATQSRRPSHHLSILMAYGNNTNTSIEFKKPFHVLLDNVLNDCFDGKYVIYGLTNNHTNPFQLWQHYRSPVYPSTFVRKQLRTIEEPYYVQNLTAVETHLNITINVLLPSVNLIKICCKTVLMHQEPGKITDVRIFNVTRSEVLITWKHARNNRCIVRYEVEQSRKCSDNSKFNRVNPSDTIFLSYHHSTTENSTCEDTQGKYRIRAIDFWNKAGPYSTIIEYP